MAFIILYPAVAVLALLIVVIIIVMLRHGPRLCKLRHTALTTQYDWEDHAYEQKVSYA
ncbi:wurmchen 2 transmembrane micropeptide [Arctopsyche grandis]|uniref:wurmchen 2 transmembrane micropeptide n=1 Tax=Arctopsyche grandis TaxID=121162 RepID=UPI00406D9868